MNALLSHVRRVGVRSQFRDFYGGRGVRTKDGGWRMRISEPHQVQPWYKRWKFPRG